MPMVENRQFYKDHNGAMVPIPRDPEWEREQLQRDFEAQKERDEAIEAKVLSLLHEIASCSYFTASDDSIRIDTRAIAALSPKSRELFRKAFSTPRLGGAA